MDSEREREVPGLKRKLLCALPAAMLPVCNLLLAALTRQAPEPSWKYLCAAILEELFFRWLLLKIWLFREKRLPQTWAVVLVSFLFAGMHLFNPQPLPAALVQASCAWCFGLWAGAAVLRGSVLFPLAAHVLLNLTAVEIGAAAAIPYLLLLPAGALLLWGRGARERGTEGEVSVDDGE